MGSRDRRGSKRVAAAAGPSKSALAATIVGLVLLTWLVLGRAVAYGFVNYDDQHYVANNLQVKAGLSWEGVRWGLTTFTCANWHPLTWWSLELDASLFGTDARGFHLTNLLLHGANTALLFWTLWRMTGAEKPSALVAALFAIHPLHVESVAWISERKDVLSTLFWVLTLLAYVRYSERPTLARYALVAAALALGLMAKPTLVTLPCVLLLLDFWPLGRWTKCEVPSSRFQVPGGGAARQKESVVRGRPESRVPSPQPLPWLFAEKIPLLLLSAASCAITLLAQSRGGAVVPAEGLTLGFRALNALTAYVAYLGKTFWPVDLAVFYPHPAEKGSLIYAAATAAALLAITLVAFAQRRRRPYLLVGWCWYLGTLIPMIGLVQVGGQGMADRYMYVPSIGVFLMIAWSMDELSRCAWANRRLTGALTAGALATCGALSWLQTGYWHDSLRLWRHAIEVTGPNSMACKTLGAALAKQGDFAAALPWLRTALEFEADDKVQADLGIALMQLDRVPESVAAFQAAVELNPDNIRAQHNLGRLLHAQGQLAQAADHLGEALRIDPADWQAHLLLAQMSDAQGAKLDAQRHWQQAVRINPSLVAKRATNAPQARSAEPQARDSVVTKGP